MGRESQRIEDGRVDLFCGTIGGRRDDRVVGAAAAQRSVREFGGQRGVLGIEPGLRDRRRKDQIGIGIRLRHGAENVVCDLASGLHRAPGFRAPGFRAPGLPRTTVAVLRTASLIPVRASSAGPAASLSSGGVVA